LTYRTTLAIMLSTIKKRRRNMNNLQESIKELAKLLPAMDVPALRWGDPNWLNRNLAIRNSKHENFEPAMALIRECLSCQNAHKRFDGARQ
jgi:hypothetical protein